MCERVRVIVCVWQLLQMDPWKRKMHHKYHLKYNDVCNDLDTGVISSIMFPL